MSDIDKSQKVLTGAGLSTLWSAVKKNATTTAQTLIDSSAMSNSDVDYAIDYDWDGQLGSTLTIDGIECVAIAKDITIQDSDLRNIAIDKNYDLGHYFQYTGTTWGTKTVDQIKQWVWGGFGTKPKSESIFDVGTGLFSTSLYLAESVNGTNGTATDDYTNYPSLYKGLTDFRARYGDNWFLPSVKEMWLCVGWYSKFTFESSTGASDATEMYWSSSSDISEGTRVQFTALSSQGPGTSPKYMPYYVRLCRAF